MHPFLFYFSFINFIYRTMKKLYLAFIAIILFSISYGQNIQLKNQGIFMQELSEEQITYSKPTQQGTPKGGIIWSEDFGGIGTSPTSTTGPWTTTNGQWTFAETNGNIWKHSFFTTSGEWSNGTPAFGSTTASNGYMLFDSDSVNFLTTPNYQDFVGSIISPSIDLTGEPSVQVSFEHSYRLCCAATLDISLGVSIDGGATWTDYNLFSTCAINPANPGVTTIDVSSVAANQPNVILRWKWDGNVGNSHYYWEIDDIYIDGAPQHDLELSQALYYHDTPNYAGSHITYTMIPANQVHPIRFDSEISNNGVATENTWLDLTVTDGSNNVAYTGSGTPTSISANTTIQNNALTTFTPSATPDTYTASYFANYNSFNLDADTTDNYDTTLFEVTTCRFARDNNINTNAGLWNGAGNSYIMGVSFQVEAVQQVTHIEVVLPDNSPVGATIYAQLYHINNFSIVSDGAGTQCEHVVTTGDLAAIGPNPNAVCLCLPQGGYTCQPGIEYLATVGHYGGANDVLIANGGTSPNWTSFLLDGTDSTWYYMTSLPMIRMLFDNCCSTPNNIDAEPINILSLEQNIPNPATNSTTINYSLTEAVDIALEITDLSGRLVLSVNEGEKAEGEHQFELNTSSFSPGTYFYSLIANEQRITNKMTVIR
jgi:hypothetical protein